MKKIMIVLACTIFFTGAIAQVSIGLKAGLNIAKENYGNKTTYTTSSKSGLCAGVFANYKFAKSFATQLEVFYSEEGVKEKYISNSETINGVVNINRINIPLQLQYITPVNFYLETGPQLGFLLSAKGVYNGIKYDFKENTQGVFFSWCIGAGYKLDPLLKGLAVNARYALGIGNSNKGAVAAESIKSNVISFSVLYTIHSITKKTTGK